MLIGKPLVVPPDLPDNTVFSRTVRAFRLVFSEAAIGIHQHGHGAGRRKNAPLVEAMIAHKVDTGKIKLPSTRRTPCDMEYTWFFGVNDVLNLLEFGSGLQSV